MKLQQFIPKTFTCLKEGYSLELFFKDLFAGLTVGLIALPLAIAFGIGSGVDPSRGLFTAIVAGFLISFLGGSRSQIGGPTGAFVVIIFGVIQRHGYEGLALATLLAGGLLILFGLLGAGSLLKWIPPAVLTGFTAGIAVVIFSSQIKDFFGIQMGALPVEFIEKWSAYIQNFSTLNAGALLVALASLAIIWGLKKKFPAVPGGITAILICTAAVWYFEWPVETIYQKYGPLPTTLPTPAFPQLSWEGVAAVFPDAVTIALLCAIESLLSAALADRITGHQHRSNGELVSQGLANIGSVLFGGIPATGAIARTTANIKMGGKTPFAGMIHALTLLALLFFFAPLAAEIPLACLAALLVWVAWNMCEKEEFIATLKTTKSNAFTLLVTFFLTIFVDLTVAVLAGAGLAKTLTILKKRKSRLI